MAFILLLLHLTTLSLLIVVSAQPHNTPLPSFTSPPVTSRPKFRYWFPDASIPAAAVQKDIVALADVSAGGLQFLGYYNQGFLPPVSTNWSTYGFGTSAFKELLRAALKTTSQHGLRFDFAVGPNTAAGVPAVPGTEGLAVELVYGSKFFNSSQRITALPGPVLAFNHDPLNGWVHEPENWGPSELVAVVATRVKSRGRRSANGGGGKAGEQVVLDKGSAVDITASALNGSFSWQAPPSTPGEQQQANWVVTAFYQRYSNERSCASVAGAPTWIGNGSWMVDHFSSAGAKKMTDFWDQQVLADKEIDGLMKKVGDYSWEDSMEMMAPLWWTHGFLDRFKNARGYDATKYLPVFFQAKNLWNSYGEPYDTSYIFDGEPADGGQYAEDYRLTLSEGYQDYLRHHQQWASARGMSHSTQPAYNMPLDMAASIPLVGAPELESLGFGESIDTYRQFTGPAHLSGRNIISTEIGAQRGGAYVQTLPKLIGLFQDSFAAGVNTLSIHGFAYGGTYSGTTWPGYTPFQYEFGEMWGPRQPAWRHLNDTLLFAARTSEVLKTGVPKIDLAFYSWKHPWTARPIYQGADLTGAGFTQDYLGPDNLVSGAATVENGILAPNGPAYKALIMLGQTKVSAAASAALLKFAQAGLPIFIVGPAPTITIGSVGQKEVTENMARLTKGEFTNVHMLSANSLKPENLFEVEIFPRVTADALDGAANSSQLFTQWRSDPPKNLELVYLLNRGQETTFSISLTLTSPDTAIPYTLNPWTGSQTPLLTYLKTGAGISTRLTLSKGQSTILAFHTPSSDTEHDPPLYIVSHSSNLVRPYLTSENHLQAYISDNEEASALLSNNAEVIIPPSSSSPPLPKITLGNWTLKVESWSAPSAAPLSTSSVTPNKTIITIPTPLQSLVPWTSIKSLERVSGIGYYSTKFTIPERSEKEGEEIGYTIHLTGKILNTVRVKVNGFIVPAIDISSPEEGRDITEFLLKKGGKEEEENVVEVEVASTLFNAVKNRLGDLKSVGLGVRVPKYYTGVGFQEFGLVGGVEVRGWRVVKLA
ncbi:hypothetical protein QBC43DRAFT_355013 [Cladorrhinum sp. PSN259]|nr:hypothetical protein QBC43DRAFT_355013 [Cladorrhinum sp. PSN259]